MIDKHVKLSASLLWLGLAFGVSLVLTIGVGIDNLSQMGEMKVEIQRMTDSRWQSSQLAQQALVLSSRNNRITLQLFLMNDGKEIEALLEERRQNTEQITALLRQIGGMVNSDEERQLLDAILLARRPYVDSDQTAVNLLVHEARRVDGRQMILTTTQPRLQVYHDAWEKYINYQSDQIAKSGAAIEVRYKRVHARTLRLFGAGVLLAIGIAGAVVFRLWHADHLMARHSRALEQVHRVLKTHTKPDPADKLWVDRVAPH